MVQVRNKISQDSSNSGDDNDNDDIGSQITEKQFLQVNPFISDSDKFKGDNFPKLETM